MQTFHSNSVKTNCLGLFSCRSVHVEQPMSTADAFMWYIRFWLVSPLPCGLAICCLARLCLGSILTGLLCFLSILKPTWAWEQVNQANRGAAETLCEAGNFACSVTGECAGYLTIFTCHRAATGKEVGHSVYISLGGSREFLIVQ